jgi:Family of unknown function (DUF5906)
MLRGREEALTISGPDSQPQDAPKERTVRVAWAPDGQDFNDVLREPGGIEKIAAIVRAAPVVERPVVPERAAPEKKTSAPRSPPSEPVKEEPPADTGTVVPFPAAARKRAPKKKKSGESADTSSSPDDAEPRTLGYSDDDMNERYALVLMASKAVVFCEMPNAPIEDRKRVLTVDGFCTYYANRFTEVRGADGRLRMTTWARRWLTSPRRRSFRGVEFFPDPNNAPGTEGYLNLWSGFAVKPATIRDPQRYSIFTDHILTNICAGNQAYAKWIFGFFASMVQRPRERAGTALVMRGKMGTGKTKVGEVIGRLFPSHYFLVDDPRYVTGNFNAHMASCLLLQADEAVWAGDKAAEGRLKGLITSPIQCIESKGVDPIRLNNYVRLVLTSNEQWVVPAGKDERRFAIFDVGDGCAQNHRYFREMDEQLADGGLEALLADLLAFDLDSVNLRAIPRTEVLLEQKIRSLDSVQSWWFERLSHGTATKDASHWPGEAPGWPAGRPGQIHCDALYADYLAMAEKIGHRWRKTPAEFGMALREVAPGVLRVRGTGADGARSWNYRMPTLEEARASFARVVGQVVDWGEGGEVHDATVTTQPVEEFTM